MKKFLSVLLVLAMLFTLAACKKEEPTVDIFAKGEGVMTYADYTAAAKDDAVVIEAFVQSCAYNAAYGNASLFLQDNEGGYYVYRMTANDDDAAKLVPGAKVRVSGYKAEWAGEVEIVDATYELLDGTYIANPADVTYDFYSEDLLAAKMNQYIHLEGFQVEASLDANGESAPFLYSWDGSGAKGSNSDLYFNVSFHGNVYNLTVESDECPEGSEVYTAVENLKIGDTVNLDGFLYWYYGANPHIHALTVTASADHADNSAFFAAEKDTEVTVTGYVTGRAYNEQYGNISFFLQDATHGYYVYRMNVTPEEALSLSEGAKVKVTGYKTEWAGEVEIDGSGATFEVLDGNCRPAALDVTSLLGTDNLEKHMNEYVAFKGVTVEPSKNPAGEDVPFLYNWDGSGAAGSNNDLYFCVSSNGATYQFTVESDEYAEGCDTYELVTQFQIGDVVDLEAFLYWYNGANPHIAKVLVGPAK